MEPFQCQNKQRLAFNMDGNPSPTLLKALNGFYGGTQKLGHLPLSFSQTLSYQQKIAFVHLKAPFLSFLMYHNVGSRELIAQSKFAVTNV